MNKNILTELKNIANSLDDNGFYKEANVISKVMVRVAAKDFSTQEGRRKVYNDDLNQYKALVDAGKTQEATNLYNGILNSFFSQYDDAMKTAWRGQADRYRLSKSMPKELKERIDAVISNNIKGPKNIQEFDAQWNAMSQKLNLDSAMNNMDPRNAAQINQIKAYLKHSYDVMSAKLKADYSYQTGLKYRPEVSKPVTKGTPAPPPPPQSANRGSGVPLPSV